MFAPARNLKSNRPSSAPIKYKTSSIISTDFKVRPELRDAFLSREVFEADERNLSNLQKILPYSVQLLPADFIIAVEHCCECHHHSMFRHNEVEYLSLANNLLREYAELAFEFSVNARFGVLRIPSRSVARIGAFEIIAIYKNNENKLNYKILHSKLQTSMWPSADHIQYGFQIFLESIRITLFDPHEEFLSAYSKSFKACPVGVIRWSDTVIGSNSEWNYPAGADAVQWIFDRKQAITWKSMKFYAVRNACNLNRIKFFCLFCHLRRVIFMLALCIRTCCVPLGQNSPSNSASDQPRHPITRKSRCSSIWCFYRIGI